MLNCEQYIINYIISLFVEAHSRNTWSVRTCYTYVSVFFLKKRSSPAIIDHDIHSFCCILTDGDIIIQMNFSTFFHSFVFTHIMLSILIITTLNILHSMHIFNESRYNNFGIYLGNSR